MHRLLFEEGNGVSGSLLPDGAEIVTVDTIPAGEYEAAQITETWVLRAPGYGDRFNYGSGAIYIFVSQYPRLVTDYGACYVAHCKCGCGGIIFAAADEPRMAADNAKEVALCIREGHTVGRMNALGVRAGRFGCQVQSAQTEMELFS